MKRTLPVLLIQFSALPLWASHLNNTLQSLMRRDHVPVAGYAIINHNRIVAANTLSCDPSIAASKYSLFQAASISKSLAATAALSLMDQGKLNIHSPANHYLISWKIPRNQYNKQHPVLVKQLMNMTSGLSVAGFPGYAKDATLPTEMELLKGTPLSNTPAIRVTSTPGSTYFYSGGGYEVLHQVITDITHLPMTTFMNQTILPKLAMTNSIFQFPLVNKTLLARVIPGFLSGPTTHSVKAGWHNYASTAAAGLWTTPIDLAKFAMNITNSYQGKKGILSKASARKMLAHYKNTPFGLGVKVYNQGNKLYFSKGGHNLGYYSFLVMFPNKGQGLVIMTNSENGFGLINQFNAVVAKRYHWPIHHIID